MNTTKTPVAPIQLGLQCQNFRDFERAREKHIRMTLLLKIVRSGPALVQTRLDGPGSLRRALSQNLKVVHRAPKFEIATLIV